MEELFSVGEVENFEESQKKTGTRVNVFVRSRPLLSTEEETPTTLLFPNEDELIIQEEKYQSIYKFDHVFNGNSTNKQVCDVICGPLVTTVLNGYNASFMVYSQTGTGKTYTMLSEDGLILQSTEKLLHEIEQCKEFTYKVKLSYLQIYQDRIYDLLFNGTGRALILREHPNEGIVVEGLSFEEIETLQQVKNLIEIGRKKLIISQINTLRFSSRSHAICLLRLEKSRNTNTVNYGVSSETFIGNVIASRHEKITSKLYLCDLAGTERLKKTKVSGKRLEEARYINTSLLELGNVIHALAARNTVHIPFRNSTLTRILKESLGGNCKANLMICVSPFTKDLKETKCSINFGQRAMLVVKQSRRNVHSRTDSHWFQNPLSRRRKFKKVDYKALSELLQLKLKELESAYRQEKENLRQFKIGFYKRNENQESSSEDADPQHLSDVDEETTAQLNTIPDNMMSCDSLDGTASKSLFKPTSEYISTNDKVDINETQHKNDPQLKIIEYKNNLQEQTFQTTDVQTQCYPIESDSDDPKKIFKPPETVGVQTQCNSFSDNTDEATSKKLKYPTTETAIAETRCESIEDIKNNNQAKELKTIQCKQSSPVTIDEQSSTFDCVSPVTSDKLSSPKTSNKLSNTFSFASPVTSDDQPGTFGFVPRATSNEQISTLGCVSPVTSDEQSSTFGFVSPVTSNKQSSTLGCVSSVTSDKQSIPYTSNEQLSTLGCVSPATSDKQSSTFGCVSSATSDQQLSPDISNEQFSTFNCVSPVTSDKRSSPETSNEQLSTFGCVSPVTSNEQSSTFNCVSLVTSDKESSPDNSNEQLSTFGCVSPVTSDKRSTPETNKEQSSTFNCSSPVTSDKRSFPETSNEQSSTFGCVFPGTSDKKSSTFGFQTDYTTNEIACQTDSPIFQPLQNHVTTSNINTGNQIAESMDNRAGNRLENLFTRNSLTISTQTETIKEDTDRKISNKTQQYANPFSATECNMEENSIEGTNVEYLCLDNDFEDQNLISVSETDVKDLSFIECSFVDVDSSFQTKHATISISPEYESFQGLQRNIKQQQPTRDIILKTDWKRQSIVSDRSSFSSIDTTDTEYLYKSDTKHVKKSLKKAKNRYEKLLKQFEELTSENTPKMEDDLTIKNSCYNLVLKFKTELEEELNKARGQLISNKKEDYTENPNENDNVGISENAHPDPLTITHENVFTAVLNTNSISDSGAVELQSEDINAYVLEGGSNEYLKSNMASDFLSDKLNSAESQRLRDKVNRNEKVTLAAIENAEIKKELLLTKLEKIRLETVLSCIMANEAADMTKEFKQLSLQSMKMLTSSRSTLSSSVSCAHLPSTSQVTFQNLPSPSKRYNYNERFLTNSETSTIGSRTTTVPTSSVRKRESKKPVKTSNDIEMMDTRYSSINNNIWLLIFIIVLLIFIHFSTASQCVPLGVQQTFLCIPDQKRVVFSPTSTSDQIDIQFSTSRSPQSDFVTQWLFKDKMSSSSHITSSYTSSSSEFDVSSMSSISSPNDMMTDANLLRRMSPYGQDDESRDDLDDSQESSTDIDSILLQYKRKDGFSLSCLPFLRKRSLRKKMRQLRQLQENQTGTNN